MTNKTLCSIWATASVYNRWLEKLRATGISERDLTFLAALDDQFISETKDGKYKATLARREAEQHFEKLFPEQVKHSTDKQGGITFQEIARARDYPIENIVDVNSRGFALCVWHKDKSPSMYCRNNWAFCFSCSKGGDTIAVYIQKHRVGFQEAVKRLQRGGTDARAE